MAASKSGTGTRKQTKSKTTTKKTTTARTTPAKQTAAKKTSSQSTRSTAQKKTTANSRKTIPVQQPQAPVYTFPLAKEILVIVALGFAVLLFFSCFQKPDSSLSWLQKGIFYLFGSASYIVPFFVFFTICFIISNYGKRGLWIRVSAICMIFAAVCTVMSLLTADAGKTGASISGLLIPVFGAVGTYIVMIVVMIVGAVMFSGKSLVQILRSNTRKAYEVVKSEQELLRVEQQIRAKERELEREREKSRRMMEQQRRVEELEAETEKEIARRNEFVRVRGIGDVTVEPDDTDLEFIEKKKKKTIRGKKEEYVSECTSFEDDDLEEETQEFLGEIHFGDQYADDDAMEENRGEDIDGEMIGMQYPDMEEDEDETILPWSTEDFQVEEDAIVSQAMHTSSYDQQEIEDCDETADEQLDLYGEYDEWTESDSLSREASFEEDREFYLEPADEIVFKNKLTDDSLFEDDITVKKESSGSPYEQELPPDPVAEWDVKNTYSNTSSKEKMEENRAKTVRTASGKVITVELDGLPGERKLPAEAKKREVAEKMESSIVPVEYVEPKEYVFPPMDLLKKGSAAGSSKDEMSKRLKETALKLQQTLQNFGVGVTVTNISCGPSVTRYELQPEMGVKVSRIVSLADDIKLNLAAEDIRIEAPIPGKAAIGIEVPNKEKQSVMLRDLLESDEFKKHGSNVVFAAGKDIAGSTILADIAKMPHLLIAGATGSGKSVCINTIIMSILYKAKPSEVKLIMIDPKVVELSIYNGIPHLMIPVVTDPKKAAGALNWAVTEMTDRYQKFAQYRVRDMKGYNEKVEMATKDAKPGEDVPKKMPQIVIIVDELADLMMVAPGDVEEAICRLAQMARAAGIHLVIATQRPSVNVITGLIKANVPSRIAFSVSSGVDSRTIIDMNGAEKLLGKGDMLFYPSGYPKPLRVQGCFVSDDEVQEVVKFLSEQKDVIGGEQNNNITLDGESGGDGAGNSRTKDDVDEYFDRAARLIIDKEKASIGMLQRVFKIGFNRAARIMDQLAQEGIVSEEEGTKPRRVLMTLEEFENR